MDQIRIESEPLQSMNELLLRIVIKRGEQRLTDEVIGADVANNQSIMEFCARASGVVGMGLADLERAVADQVMRARDWWARTKGAKGLEADGFQGKFISSAELERLDAKHRWLIKHILVADQPAMVGGPRKSMKTSFMVDMAVSLGSGKMFLGKFVVPEKVRVAVLSGESGQITLRETAIRVAKSKGVKLSECDVLWGFDLPRLGVEADLMALSKALRDHEVKVVFIDPAYLCLLAGSPDLNASNMFDVGPLLLRIAKLCREVGTTLILLHHTNKPASMLRMSTGEPLELEDLAYSGFQEFARQWVLINRRQKYEPGTGKHEMWLNLGGSAGVSGLWAVDVDEGRLNDDFGGRKWFITVSSAEAARERIAEAKEQKKDAKRGKKRVEEVQAVLKALSSMPNGDTQTNICKSTGLHSRTVGPILQNLLEQGKIESIMVAKNSGNGKGSFPGWRLSAQEALQRAGGEERISELAKVVRGRGCANGALYGASNRNGDDRDWLDDVGPTNAV